MELREALESLDPRDDGHWTSNGIPRVDVVSGLVGREVLRQEITDAAPELTRSTLAAAREQGSQGSDAPEAAPDPEAEVDRILDGKLAQTLPLVELAGDPRLLRRALAELEAEALEIGREKGALEKRHQENARKAVLLSRLLERVQPVDRGKHQRQIRAYLDRQAGRRPAPAPSPFRPGAAPIDAVMARKTGHGRRRPVFPAPKVGS